jgi:hypothetical protein
VELISGVANVTATIRAAYYDSTMLKMVLGNSILRSMMTDPNDNRFPYVLLCSTLGTIISLASVWLETYHAFAPVVGA